VVYLLKFFTKKSSAMKKIFTYCALIASISFFTSCSKDVKTPQKARTNTTSTTASTTAQPTQQNQPQQGSDHTCGGGSSNNNNYDNNSSDGY